MHAFDLTVTVADDDEAEAHKTLGKLFEAADQLGVAITWFESRPVSGSRL